MVKINNLEITAEEEQKILEAKEIMRKFVKVGSVVTTEIDGFLAIGRVKSMTQKDGQTWLECDYVNLDDDTFEDFLHNVTVVRF